MPQVRRVTWPETARTIASSPISSTRPARDGSHPKIDGSIFRQRGPNRFACRSRWSRHPPAEDSFPPFQTAVQAHRAKPEHVLPDFLFALLPVRLPLRARNDSRDTCADTDAWPRAGQRHARHRIHPLIAAAGPRARRTSIRAFDRSHQIRLASPGTRRSAPHRLRCRLPTAGQ